MNHQYYHHIIEYDRWISAPCHVLPLPELCKGLLFSYKNPPLMEMMGDAVKQRKRDAPCRG